MKDSTADTNPTNSRFYEEMQEYQRLYTDDEIASSKIRLAYIKAVALLDHLDETQVE